jgi:YbbR domain-containing protein
MAWRPFRNLGLKIAALGLGTVLWITVSGQQVERDVLVQLQFRNVPAALEISGDAPRTVDVRLRGTSGQISRLEPTEVIATIDLIDARPGVRVFPLTPDHISVPLGVEVKSVDPSTVSLTLELSTTAEAVVRPTIDGEPARGFEVGAVSVDPQTVTVVGPQGQLKDRPSAVTERISIEGATGTVTETVEMGVSDPAVRLQQARTARVTITVLPSPVVHFSNRPVRFRNAAPGRAVSAEPSSVTVTVRGGRDVLAKLSDVDIEPYIDLTGVGSGHYTLQVRVDPRSTYEIGTIDPATVAVTIR